MSGERSIPRIGLTLGDPQGVGPELIVRTLAQIREPGFVPLALGDGGVLREAAARFAPGLRIEEAAADALPRSAKAGVLPCLSLSQIDLEELRGARPPGFRFGREVYRYLTTAIDLALEGALSALVTAPLAKTAFKAAGIDAPGHTEILAERAGVGSRYAMMLAGAKLNVVLATIHTPLAEVPARATKERIVEAGVLAHEALRDRFGIERPRLAVAGLNPHAGESGLIGSEEIETVRPAVEALREKGIDAAGPLSPDTVFYRATQGAYDAVVALYHDQGLIPFKLLHFTDGVNLTLGLPFVRTSPDHGTAFDIAWKGTASLDSFRAALELAARLSKNRRVA